MGHGLATADRAICEILGWEVPVAHHFGDVMACNCVVVWQKKAPNPSSGRLQLPTGNPTAVVTTI